MPSAHSSACLLPLLSPGPGRSRRLSVKLSSRRTLLTSTHLVLTSQEQPFSLHHPAQLRWLHRAAAAGQLPSNPAALLPCRPPPPPLCRRPPPRRCRHPPRQLPAGATGPAPPTPGPAASAGLAPCSDTKQHRAATGSCHPHHNTTCASEGIHKKNKKFFEESYFSYFLKNSGLPLLLTF